MIFSLFQSATVLNTLSHSSCVLSVFKYWLCHLFPNRWLFTCICRKFAYVAKYAFPQAPSHLYYALPGSASNSRNGNHITHLLTLGDRTRSWVMYPFLESDHLLHVPWSCHSSPDLSLDWQTPIRVINSLYHPLWVTWQIPDHIPLLGKPSMFQCQEDFLWQDKFHHITYHNWILEDALLHRITYLLFSSVDMPENPMKSPIHFVQSGWTRLWRSLPSLEMIFLLSYQCSYVMPRLSKRCPLMTKGFPRRPQFLSFSAQKGNWWLPQVQRQQIPDLSSGFTQVSTLWDWPTFTFLQLTFAKKLHFMHCR